MGDARLSSTGAGSERGDPRRWWALGVLCLSLLLIIVSNSSLNVALPTLSRELGATNEQLQWVVAVYSLVFAGLLFSTGALGDRFGRKGTLQIGLALFFAGSALAAASHSMGALIACRAVMGVAAALIMPSTLSILVNIFPATERPKAIAIWASVTGVGGVFGPVGSGWLLGHFWYGAVFLINLPIVAIALIAGAHFVPRSRDPERGRLDPVGAVLSIIGLTTLVYAVIEAPRKGWGSGITVASFALSAVVLLLFAVWELHVDEPMLDIRYFRNPAFSTATGGMILVFLASYGMMFEVVQYFQLVVGYSPLSAAARLVPAAPVMIVVSTRTPRLTARFGSNRVVASGILFSAAAMLGFSQLRTDSPYAFALGCFVLQSIGIGLAMSPMTAAIMAAVPARRAGAGSAMNDTTRELGATLGVAVLGSVAASHYAHKIAPLVRQLPPDRRHDATSSLAGTLAEAKRLPGGGASLIETARSTFMQSLHMAVGVGAVLALVAAVLVYRYLPGFTHHEADESVEGSEPTSPLSPPTGPERKVPDRRVRT